MCGQDTFLRDQEYIDTYSCKLGWRFKQSPSYTRYFMDYLGVLDRIGPQMVKMGFCKAGFTSKRTKQISLINPE